MNESDVEVVRRETVYRGFFRIDRYQLRHRLHDGGWSEILVREVFERGHAAAVLPYDPDRDEVVLIEQFRVGALSAGADPWVAEVVAGIIEEGENAASVAAREAREETGCELTDLVEVCNYFSTPGGSSETVSLFCGRIDSRLATGVHGNKDELEDILVYALPFEEALARLQRGEINNAATIIALQWLAINRAAVRERWQSAGAA